MDGQKEGLIDGWMEQKDGWMMDEWIDEGWMDVYIDRRMDRQIDERMNR